MINSIKLRQWADGALETIDVSSLANDSITSSFGADSLYWPADIRRSMALSSETYLKSALKVARSLANQICQANNNKDGSSGGECSQQVQLPAPGSNWADRITVHLSNNPIDVYDGDLQPLPFSHENPRSDPRELQDILNSLIPDESLFAIEDNVLDGASSCDSEQNGVSFHNVARAEILPFPINNLNSSIVDEMPFIYSLGIVFYELFSGGEKHPAIHPQTNSCPRARNESNHFKGDAGEPMSQNGHAHEPNPHGNGCAFDMAGKLNILDNIGDIGDPFDKMENEHPCDDFDMKFRNKKKGPQTRRTMMRSVSVEPLKLKGLPMRLCDLISNMIDCVNGDLSGDEAYRNMSDVCSDLQLMLDRPGRFLHDLDLDNLSLNGLQLNEALFDRQMDFSILQNSYRRSISGANECAIIVGPSGIGKSVLANRLGTYVSSSGGLFLSGKFDQLPHAKPFSALASAFNGYCNKISKDHLQTVASKLKVALGREALHLVKVIPSLITILGDLDNKTGEDQDCVDAQKRLQYLLCQFVSVISSCSGSPVTLFLDDLQWADPASISAINQILLMSESSYGKRQFFFLGSSREEGMLDHAVGDMVSSICHFGVHAKIVKLVCMDKETTNTMVSDLLCLSPRLTRTLSEIIFHKTKGNPLFFSQLMVSLCKDGLVRLSLSRRRWEWDEEKIQSRKLPDDVAAFLTSSIERLPQEVQMALSALSCFGHASNATLIKVLEGKCGNVLIEPLEIAVAEGVLDRVNGTYSFGHDRLQEAAYNMIPPEDRCVLHFKYGAALVPRSLELQDDGLLFTAASQINRGGPVAVEDAEQAVLIANLNLTAGRKAMEMSDFSAAYSFFDNGISFLRKRHWQDHYDLSLQLFDAATDCALVLGDITSLKLLTNQIITFAKSFEEKLNATYNTVSALAYASQLPESVNRSILVLSQLGEELRDSYSESDTKLYIEQTQAMLKGYTTNKELIEYRRMVDPKKIMAMKFYARLEMSFHMTKVEAQPIVTMKMVQLSITRGMSPVSPLGFTYFGMLLGRLGDIQEGCRYVRIGRQLLDRIGSKEVAGEVIAIGTQIMCFVEPVQATLETYAQGHTTAMAAGDTHGALLNSVCYVGTSFWAGTKLSVWRERYDSARRLMEEHDHMTFFAHISQWEEIFSILTGTNDSNVSEIEGVKNVREGNPHASYTATTQEMYIKFMFREYEEMKVLAEIFFDFNLRSWTLFYYSTAHTFYSGLVSSWVYRQSKDAKWADRARKAKFLMKKWADCKWNFQNKLYLMEAEEAFCYNDIANAECLYEKALSSAREHRFIHEEALAHELAGHFFLELKRKGTAVEHFMQAHEKYHEWGAVAKSNSVLDFVQRFIGEISSLSAYALSDLTPSSNGNVDKEDKNTRKRMPERLK